MELLVSFPGTDLRPLYTIVTQPNSQGLSTALQLLKSHCGVPDCLLSLSTEGGVPLHDESDLFSRGSCQTVFLKARIGGGLLGGKGGFGSMLRAQGGRMSSRKSTNHDACRDLSGRRLKTLKIANRLADALDQQEEAQEDKKRRVQKRIEKSLMGPEEKKIRFDDEGYLEEHRSIMRSVRKAVRESARIETGQDSKTEASNESDLGCRDAPQTLGTSSTTEPKRKETALAFWDNGTDADSEELSDDEEHDVAKASVTAAACQ